MAKKTEFDEVMNALQPTPTLKGKVVSEGDDNLVIKTKTGVFRLSRASVSEEKKTDDGVEITLQSDAKVIRETLVDLAHGIGAITEDVFGPGGLGGIAGKDCDCRCLCECRCDCDCRCLCDDSELSLVLTKVQELAKFGQLNINIDGRVSSQVRRI